MVEIIEVAVNKAKELCESYQYEAAETFCRQILKIDDSNDTAWFLLGVSCGCRGKKEDALLAFDKAADLAKVPENRAYALQMRAKL